MAMGRRAPGAVALIMDRAEKPGWVTTRPGARISFPLRLGDAPHILVTWMEGYDAGLADALLEVFESEPLQRGSTMTAAGAGGAAGHALASTTLHGVWWRDDDAAMYNSGSNNATLNMLAVLHANASQAERRLRARPGSDVTLRVTQLTPGKFKLVSLSSC